jgi:hypothetical protein
VNTGADKTYAAVQARLAKWSGNRHGRRRNDLFILS